MIRGVQGAVALRRQRSRRDDRTRRLTNASLEGIEQTQNGQPHGVSGQHKSSVFGSTLFHIGLVFLFIGFLMVITAMVPGYVKKAKAFDLVGTGTFFVVIGGVMTLINRAITKQEDNQLERYVSDRLSRSKSGCRLVRDEESGLTPEVHRRGRRPSRSPRNHSRAEDSTSPGRSLLSRKESSHQAGEITVNAEVSLSKISEEVPKHSTASVASVADHQQVKLVVKTVHTPEKRRSSRPSISGAASSSATSSGTSPANKHRGHGQDFHASTEKSSPAKT